MNHRKILKQHAFPRTSVLGAIYLTGLLVDEI